MIMHKVGAKVWIARIMITWGIITIGTGFVQSATHLYAACVLLGIAEAGFFPGIILYFTYWFRSKERGRACSSLILALPVGTIIGSPLSTWIMDNIAWSGIAGWRWLFILEGIPAVILGVIALFYLKNRPRDAKWLTDEEKNWLENELDKERQQSLVVNKASKLAMVKDSKVWKLALIYFANYSAMYGLSFFLPSIIKSFSTGSSNMEIGWLTIIPAIVGIPAILFFGWSSDKRNEHKNHLIVSFLIAAAGFIACGFANSTTTLIVAITFAAIGLYGFCGAFFSFMTLFFTETTAPAGIAMVNAFASLGGFIGPMIFGQLAIFNGMFLIAALAILACVILLTFKQTGLSSESRNDNIEITTVNQNVNIEKIS